MSYKRAEKVLPEDIIDIIQQYVDGECIYIPRKENKRKKLGENSKIREELYERNIAIYDEYIRGIRTSEISIKYFLSEKSVQRIIREMKKIA